MAYNQQLAKQIRLQLSETNNVEEKEMMGGLTFMVNDKMCIGIIGNEMMCRLNPELQNVVLEKNGCRIMDFTGRPMKGYVMIDEFALKSNKDMAYWIELCLDYNKIAKSSKKKKS